MKDEQFKEICNKLDKILAVMAIQNIEDVDDRIYTLKSLGFTSDQVGSFVGIKNVRQYKGWKRK